MRPAAMRPVCALRLQRGDLRARLPTSSDLACSTVDGALFVRKAFLIS